MRKLVTIREITNIEPIPNADAIELVILDGWKCVAKKNEFKIGQSAVYFEIDSALPLDDERFSFLSKINATEIINKLYSVLRTQKFRGQVSQGLALPLDSFPELNNSEIKIDENSELGLGGVLGIIKYEKEIPAEIENIAIGMFPTSIKSTSLERVQNLTSSDLYSMVLDDKNNNPQFNVNIKLNGLSATFFFKNGKWGIASRNVDFNVDTDYADLPSLVKSYFDIFFKVIKPKFENVEMPSYDFALQGEIITPKFAKNFEKVKDTEFYAFKVFNINSSEMLNKNEFYKFCAKYDINQVPSLNFEPTLSDILGEDFDEYLNIEKQKKSVLNIEEKNHINKCLTKFREYFLNLANGKGLYQDKREGIVIYYGKQDAFKAISNTFLLKEK